MLNVKKIRIVIEDNDIVREKARQKYELKKEREKWRKWLEYWASMNHKPPNVF